ncbi:hypothetical protein Acr_05g0001650 [Actinidia rufa]|uniref:Uncharacterized protein n=1 Tax=Actinidia rufa TaxID=165716 RepID=A0A7J0EJZ3_9ERIC|nr:hypothetical protein Acr_05g0001650 [Actinidia rufa]
MGWDGTLGELGVALKLEGPLEKNTLHQEKGHLEKNPLQKDPEFSGPYSEHASSIISMAASFFPASSSPSVKKGERSTMGILEMAIYGVYSLTFQKTERERRNLGGATEAGDFDLGAGNFDSGAGGSIQAPVGSIQASEGSVQATNGSIQATNGSIQVTDGSIQATDGLIQRPDGSIQAIFPLFDLFF